MRLLLLALLFSTAPLARAGETGKYGIDLPAGEVTPVSVAVADLAAHAGTARKFSGRITDVCQKTGCWVMLEDQGQAVRVMLGDHDFFIPKDVRGPAVVYGVLSRKELSPEAVAHMAAETSSGAAVLEQEYRIVAQGVEVSG
ncbi:MAG: DUF4920 domain-containing protein [Pseudoxanthomonas sp.]|nr:DUF4920 domain-containing protein [Pseudoxanthomonas sp.]